MSDIMKSIVSGMTAGPRRTMIYGPHGVGKSTLAANSDSPIFLSTEDGLADIECESFPMLTSLSDFNATLRALCTEDHSYRTVVIDSLDWLERLIWTEALLDTEYKNIADVPYGRGYANAIPLWDSVLKVLTWLRATKDMNIVMISHAKIARFEDPEQESYDRYSPKLHKAASALCQEWSDEVLFATYKTYTKQNDEGFNRKRVVGIGAGERVLRTTDRPAHVAKNRLGLPDEIPMTWEAYSGYFKALGV